MKWLFVCFLLINIAFFSYSNYFLSKDIVIDSLKDTTKKNQFKLLSEINPDDLIKIKSKLVVQSILEINEDSILSIPSIDRSYKISTNQCFTIGPVDKVVMNDIRNTLEKEYFNYISFEIDATSPVNYHRIYIPPQKDRSTVDNILKKLDENSLDDHYVMTIEGRKNAIALGVFKNRNTAEEIAAKVKYLGFSTIIESITKDKNSLYNLQIEFSSDKSLDFYNKFIDQNNLKSLACKNKD